jgi:hypothetical protein
MAGKKKAAPAPVAPEEVEAAPVTQQAPAVPEQAAAPAKATGPIVVKYRDHEGRTTEREFSAEVHGPDFAKLAAEFKETNAPKIIA